MKRLFHTVEVLFGFVAFSAMTVDVSRACGPDCVNEAIPSTELIPRSPRVFDPGLDAEGLIRTYRVLRGLDDLPYEQDGKSQSGVSEWRRVAALLNVDPGDVSMDVRNPNPYDSQYVQNCADDAFRTAAETLAARATRYGAKSPKLARWVTAQRMVFAACANDTNTPIPDEPDPRWHKLERQDRAYQLAAASMYRFDDSAAINAFSDIARDRTSPWRKVALYLVARVRVRRLSLWRDNLDNQNALEFVEELQKGVKQGKYGSYSPAVERMATRVLRWASDSPHAFQAMVSRIENFPASSISRDDLRAYIWQSRFREAGLTSIQASTIDTHGGALDTWLQLARCERVDDACSKLAKKLYKAKRSIPWLIVAADFVSANDPERATLYKALQRIPRKAPQYPAARLEIARMDIQVGNKAHARQMFKELEELGVAGGPMEDLRFLLAEQPVEQVAALSRLFNREVVFEGSKAVTQEGQSPANQSPASIYISFPQRSSHLLNGMSSEQLADLADASTDQRTADRLRAASFTRAVIDQNPRVLDRLTAPIVKMLIDRVSERIQEDPADQEDTLRRQLLETFNTEYSQSSPHIRRLGHLFLVALVGEEAVPYFSRATGFYSCYPIWWCGPDALRTITHNSTLVDARGDYPRGAVVLEQDVPAPVLSRYAKSSAPVWLGEQILAAVAKEPNHPLVPALLSRYIWGVRGSCGDPARKPFVRKAFTLLHTKYKDSPFAALTPYWF